MITLNDDDAGVLGPLVLSREYGFIVSSFDPGFPSVRDDLQPRVQADGMRDYTQFYGESTVAIEAMIVPPTGVSRQSLVDLLAQYCHPKVRAYIHWTLNDSPSESRCLMIRGSRLSRAITASNRLAVQCQWVAARGVQESSSVHTVSVPLSSGTLSLTGRSYPLSFPRDYGTLTLPQGTADAHNNGNQTTYPLIRVWGSVTNPDIINVTTGKRYKLIVSIPAGAYLDIDTGQQTILMNGDPLDSRYGTMDNALSTWWGLVPGENMIAFYADSSTGTGVKADFIYRDAWI